jgi:flagellar protein FlgJ
MSISINSDLLYSSNANAVNESSKAENLQAKLKDKSATDEEMMDVCKSFEAYMLEQVMKAMEKTIPESEEENPYLEQFGDMRYEQYAKGMVEGQGIGIAQMLYEAMKRNA